MTDTPQPIQDLLNGVKPTLEAELNVSKINIGKKKSASGEGNEGDESSPEAEGAEDTEIELEGRVTMVASPLTIDTKVSKDDTGYVKPIEVTGEVHVAGDPVIVNTNSDSVSNTNKPIEMKGPLNLIPTSI